MKPEARISQSIRDVLNQVGFHVFSTEQGFRRDRGGTRCTPGIPDLIVMGHGRTLFVEVKTAKKQLTIFQRLFFYQWKASGGTALVWRSADDAFDWLVSEGIIEESPRAA